MNKREKIILIITLVVMVYGLVDFLFFSKKNKSLKTEQLIADANQITEDFAAGSMAKISKIEMLTKKASRLSLVSKIESDWEHDPFIQPVKPATQAAVSSHSVSLFTYSGYMSMGKTSFAIINGVEYRPGETIKVYGYKVIKITPKKVILQKETDQAVIFLKEE